MKKIPLVTMIIGLCSILLFGFFIISYNNYTYSLEYQFESQASSRLSRTTSTTRTTLDLRLSNQIRDIETVAAKLKNSNTTYPSRAFNDFLNTCSDNTLRSACINETKDLIPYSESTDDKELYLNLLFAGDSIITNTNNSIYILYPYTTYDSNVLILIKTMSMEDFNQLNTFSSTEYRGNTFLVNATGRILASDQEQALNGNYFHDVENSSFIGKHSFEQLRSDLFDQKSGITHYKLESNDIYAYYSPTTICNLYLIHTAPSSVLDQDSKEISEIARKFMNTVLVIVFILVFTLLIIGMFYTQKINKNRDSLLLEQQRYRIALSHSKDTIWEYDIKTDTLTKSDIEYGLIPGYQIIRKFRETILDHEILHPDDIESFIHFCDSLSSDEAEFRVEVRAKNDNEEYVWYELYGSKLFDSDKKPISVIGQTCNINDKKLEIELLKQKSSQDPLTKLYNRESVSEQVAELISSFDSPVILGCLIIDIDNFKDLNEKLGHLFGDAVLIDVSGKLNKLFGSENIVGRIGGDKFIVIINNAPSVTYIEEMAQQTCKLFRTVYTGDDSNLELSCSMGVSLYPSDGNNFDSLFDKAQLALYYAKSKGKEHVIFFDSSMENLSLIDTDKLKLRQFAESDYHHEERSLVDSSIIANSIEILFDSREIDVSINMILSLIGIYYNLSCIHIFEYSADNKFVSITHEWGSDPSYKLFNHIKNAPIDRVKGCSFYQKEENGIMYCDDISMYYPKDEKRHLIGGKHLPTSVFQCGVSDHGHYIGFISFCICEDIHNWIKNEIDSLSLLSKIIGSYLIRLRSMQKADYISQKDMLTNAYNFNTFLTVANQRLQNESHDSFAMIYLDIFQFKLINDNYGYQAGDNILIHLADILNTVGGDDSILCRITGDKFALLLTYRDLEELSKKANRIIDMSKQIRSSDGSHYKLNVMIGLYVIAKHESAIVAVDRANIARKNAQKLRKENFKFFNEEMRLALIEQKNIEDVMEDALKAGEFTVFYQPKININTNRICGAEALIRWERPGVGLVSPVSFIPLFEDNGFITQIDYYVLEQVCMYIKDKLERGIEVFPISVNFSREHFKTDELPDHLLHTVEYYNIPPQLIEVEITESAFVNSDRYWYHILQRIRSLGFGLAMDDFGSGLSSLNLLSDLPFKVLKIDKDFFHSKTTHTRERIVISNVVHMAQELEMEVICEGVETLEQLKFLQSIGCYMAQGYYYDKPLPMVEFDHKYFEA